MIITAAGNGRCQRKTDTSSGIPLQAPGSGNPTFALRSWTVFRNRILPAGSVGRRSFGNSTPNGRMCNRWSHPGFEVSRPCVEIDADNDCRQEPRRAGVVTCGDPGSGETTGNYRQRRRIPAGGGQDPRGFFLPPISDQNAGSLAIDAASDHVRRRGVRAGRLRPCQAANADDSSVIRLRRIVFVIGIIRIAGETQSTKALWSPPRGERK